MIVCWVGLYLCAGKSERCDRVCVFGGKILDIPGRSLALVLGMSVVLEGRLSINEALNLNDDQF